MTHFEKYNVLDNAQHGFRKNRSTISQLIITVNDFASTLRDQKQTDAILLDFSKAFDKVDHNGLLLKLEHLGIRGSLLDWTRSFFGWEGTESGRRGYGICPLKSAFRRPPRYRFRPTFLLNLYQ